MIHNKMMDSLMHRCLLLVISILTCSTQIGHSQTVSRVELVGAGQPHMGNLMVATDEDGFQFRPLCDNYMNMTKANAVCIALGFPRALRFTRHNYFGRRSQKWSPDGWKSLVGMICADRVLQNCKVYENLESGCITEEVAGVECQTDSMDYGCSPDDFICRGSPSPTSNLSSLCINHSQLCDGMHDCPDGSDEAEDLCKEDDIMRLESDIMTELPANTVAGTIFTKQDNSWGTSCGYAANKKIAQVACRNLGYEKGLHLPFYRAYFGEGSFRVHRAYDIQCNGQELTLDQCPRRLSNISICGHAHDLGVLCHDGDLSVQLVGGTTPASGRLEIISSGTSSSAAMCDIGFDDLDAKVVCRMLGYDGAQAIAQRGIPIEMGSKDVWKLLLDCDGTEKSISDCRMKIKPDSCSHRQTVAVTCLSETSVDQVLRSMLPADCGQPEDASTRFLTTLVKIRHGSIPSRLDIPWLANLQYKRRNGKYFHTCGAVIISEFYLLSAAHCFDTRGPLHLIVRIGNYNNDFSDSSQQDFSISKVTLHEYYTEVGFFENDIALIKIEAVNGRGIRFGDRVKPVCLPSVEDAYENQSSCEIAGWGQPYQDLPTTVVPRRAAIVPASHYKCEYIYGTRNYTSSMACFGGHDLRITCKGDSGGPLTCINGQGRHVLYGITSSGGQCLRDNRIPMKYTRVTTFLRWILENIINDFTANWQI